MSEDSAGDAKFVALLALWILASFRRSPLLPDEQSKTEQGSPPRRSDGGPKMEETWEL